MIKKHWGDVVMGRSGAIGVLFRRNRLTSWNLLPGRQVNNLKKPVGIDGKMRIWQKMGRDRRLRNFGNGKVYASGS